MSEKAEKMQAREKDITDDFLLCNRCGSCKAICPLYAVYREEWAGARGKVELAEAFFRGEKIDEKQIQKVFDICLHCQTCEENCPTGMRADEVVMAVRVEMARRGLIPRMKRIALKGLEGMDNALFKLMRMLGISRKAPLHGTGGRSPLRFLFPLLGWPLERYVPLPKNRAFLADQSGLHKAQEYSITFPEIETVRKGKLGRDRALDPDSAADLLERVHSARERNLSEGRCVYYFIGHTVNHFFPEEAEAIVRVLNILGIDVLAPADQVCCGAPVYYSGDVEGARKIAYEALEKFQGYQYDWIVTSCSSGGLMLKDQFPRLFDLTSDGFFKISWDAEMETFRRVPERNDLSKQYPYAADLYNEYVEEKAYDINELIVEMLGLQKKSRGFELLFGKGSGESAGSESGADASAGIGNGNGIGDLPIVTYHHPCHLNRGQSVDWQPEILLESLPGYRYVRMPDADRCCGGGGTFTFAHSGESSAVAGVKADAIKSVKPDIVATACPLCRIQLMDIMQRENVDQAMPVRSPVELLDENISSLLES
jgi:glycolate oxidase iron-sulfur subunit